MAAQHRMPVAVGFLNDFDPVPVLSHRIRRSGRRRAVIGVDLGSQGLASQRPQRLAL
jgi:hypothetical protein